MLNHSRYIFLISIAMLLLSGVVLGLYAQSSQTTSVVSFRIKNAGITAEGKFEKFKTNIDYNSKEPEKSSFEGVLETASINTGIDLRDKHLRDAPYFECSAYPYIRFKSVNVKKVNDGMLEVNGNLTIKQTTRPVKLMVRVAAVNGRVLFTSELKINRLDFGIGESSWTLATDLLIKLAILD